MRTKNIFYISNHLWVIELWKVASCGTAKSQICRRNISSSFVLYGSPNANTYYLKNKILQWHPCSLYFPHKSILVTDRPQKLGYCMSLNLMSDQTGFFHGCHCPEYRPWIFRYHVVDESNICSRMILIMRLCCTENNTSIFLTRCIDQPFLISHSVFSSPTSFI